MSDKHVCVVLAIAALPLVSNAQEFPEFFGLSNDVELLYEDESVLEEPSDTKTPSSDTGPLLAPSGTEAEVSEPGEAVLDEVIATGGPIRTQSKPRTRLIATHTYSSNSDGFGLSVKRGGVELRGLESNDRGEKTTSQQFRLRAAKTLWAQESVGKLAARITATDQEDTYAEYQLGATISLEEVIPIGGSIQPLGLIVTADYTHRDNDATRSQDALALSIATETKIGVFGVELNYTADNPISSDDSFSLVITRQWKRQAWAFGGGLTVTDDGTLVAAVSALF